MGYEGTGEVADIVDLAQQTIYNVTEGKTSEDYKPPRVADRADVERARGDRPRGGRLAGVPTGFAELDELTNGLHPGQMIIIAARPAIGKSTLGLDIARSASIKHKQTTAMFSLEMSKHEITMRLLSAEARIPLQTMRTGQMRDDDWVKLTRRLGEMASAPLYIDDSPNLTMMEIRAKARRMKQRYDLKLVIIDYLQLMSSGKKVENRQVEVSRVLPPDQAAGQGARDPRHRDLPAQPRLRAAHRQEARSCPTCASPARSSRTPTW